jgi:virulence factor Mce-like protein
METRSVKRKKLLPAVAFILVGVILAIGLWTAFGGTVPFAPTKYEVNLALPDASNLTPGAAVTISGVTVGHVTQISWAGDSARVRIELDSEYAPLRSDARATLRTKTLLGEAYVELTPGSQAAPSVHDGGMLASGQVQAAQRLGDVLQTFAPRTRARLRGLFSGLAGALAHRAVSINDSLGHIAPVTVNLAEVAGQVADQSNSLRTLLASAGGVFGVLGHQQDALRTAVHASDDVLQATAERDHALAGTVRALPGFLNSLRRSMVQLGAASGDLGRAVTAVAPEVPLIDPVLRAIDAQAPRFQALFDRLSPVIRAGDRGLPALGRTLRSALPALAQVYPAARQLIPVLQLLGLVKQSLITTLANVAQIHGGYVVGPGNTVTNYVPGVITVWNETIGGWVKRLPSHRGNAYPSPGFLSEMGHYDSYDCRQLHNPPVLPPLGSAPPCVLQGPWKFDGKSAYYPRLQPSPP